MLFTLRCCHPYYASFCMWGGGEVLDYNSSAFTGLQSDTFYLLKLFAKLDFIFEIKS